MLSYSIPLRFTRIAKHQSFNHNNMKNLQFASLDDLVETRIRNEAPESPTINENESEIEKRLLAVVESGKPVELSGKDLTALYAISQRNGWQGGAMRVAEFYKELAKKNDKKTFVFDTTVSSEKITARRSRNKGIYYSFSFESGTATLPPQNALLPLGLKSLEKGQTVKITISANDADQWSYNAEF